MPSNVVFVVLCVCVYVCVCFHSSPDGYLYDKEAILENLLHQKRESEQRREGGEGEGREGEIGEREGEREERE